MGEIRSLTSLHPDVMRIHDSRIASSSRGTYSSAIRNMISDLWLYWPEYISEDFMLLAMVIDEKGTESLSDPLEPGILHRLVPDTFSRIETWPFSEAFTTEVFEQYRNLG